MSGHQSFSIRETTFGSNVIRQRASNGQSVDAAIISESWRSNFTFLEEDPGIGRCGLRKPQAGALHALFAHWSTRRTEPVNIVLPTGTGKTDVMIAALASSSFLPVLVLVPSDALRTQISEAFINFGVLKDIGVFPPDLQGVFVGTVHSGFSSVEGARQFVRQCNVVVATPHAILASSESVREGMLDEFDALFVDEAHHIVAETWNGIRNLLSGRPIVQFTATPFREDRKPLGGRIIYEYPLREAQRIGVFRRINYHSVTDFKDPDRAVAAKSIEIIRHDISQGLDHILMARASNIRRARQILKLYQELAPDLSPITLHSKLSTNTRQRGVAALKSLDSRIVVCVNMLGEGFDLPSLKIAAIHDPQKSIGVTLQFVGRFTRSSSGSIGDASVVVARQIGSRDAKLQALYSESSDWNEIIADLSEESIGIEREVSDFIDGFNSTSLEMAIDTISPKMSTVIYRAKGDSWNPDGVYDVYPVEKIITNPLPSHREYELLWFVIESRAPVEWSSDSHLEHLSYELFIAFRDQSTGLLFINSSLNSGFHLDLAKALCPDGVERVEGEEVFRSYGHLERVVPTNIGTKDIFDRDRSHTMHTGANVTEGLLASEMETKAPTNLFAKGWENGNRTTVGVSMRGRIWSFEPAPTIRHWVEWCRHIGSKINDHEINVDEIYKGFIRPVRVNERPEVVAISVDWPDSIKYDLSENLEIIYDESRVTLLDTSFAIREFNDEGPILASLVTDHGTWDFNIEITKGLMRFDPVDDDLLLLGSRAVGSLADFLDRCGLSIMFEGEMIVDESCMKLEMRRDLEPFERSSAVIDAWAGIDKRKESQKRERLEDSIQFRMVELVSELDNWDLIVDDDSAGEIADIVAVRLEDGQCRIMLVHCKFSSSANAGARLNDLYEVCGQAMRSAHWRGHRRSLMENLVRREMTRQREHGYSGIIHGSQDRMIEMLDQIERSGETKFDVVIAQPGISISRTFDRHLQLLAATAEHIRIQGKGRLQLYCSE